MYLQLLQAMENFSTLGALLLFVTRKKIRHIYK